MKKSILIACIMLLPGACEKQRFDNRTPKWVEELIEEMEGDPYYRGSVISRYTWSDHYYYEVFIPVSSCAYCDVYDSKGNRLNWDEYDLEDYLEGRTNMVIIWREPTGYMP